MALVKIDNERIKLTDGYVLSLSSINGHKEAAVIAPGKRFKLVEIDNQEVIPYKTDSDLVAIIVNVMLQLVVFKTDKLLKEYN